MSSAYLDMPRSHGRRQWPTPYRRSRSPRLNWGFFAASNSGRRTLGGVEHHCHAQRDCAYVQLTLLLPVISPSIRPLAAVARRHQIGDALAVLVIVGVVASMFAMPLISVLSDRTHAIGPSYPVDGWRRSAVRADPR